MEYSEPKYMPSTANERASASFEEFCINDTNWHKARLKKYNVYLCIPSVFVAYANYMFDGKTAVLAFDKKDVELLPVSEIQGRYSTLDGKILTVSEDTPLNWTLVKFTGDGDGNTEAIQVDKRYEGCLIETPAGLLREGDWLLRSVTSLGVFYRRYGNQEFQARYSMQPFTNSELIALKLTHPDFNPLSGKSPPVNATIVESEIDKRSELFAKVITTHLNVPSLKKLLSVKEESGQVMRTIKNSILKDLHTLSDTGYIKQNIYEEPEKIILENANYAQPEAGIIEFHDKHLRFISIHKNTIYVDLNSANAKDDNLRGIKMIIVGALQQIKPDRHPIYKEYYTSSKKL